MEKNEAQISGFAVVKKAPSPCKNFFSKKKFFQLICADTIFKMVCGKFFKINGSRVIQVSVILMFRKMVLHNKISNKTRLTQNQENSAHRFVDNYLTNHLVKFLQDRITP